MINISKVNVHFLTALNTHPSIHSPSQETPLILANPLGQAVSVRTTDMFFTSL